MGIANGAKRSGGHYAKALLLKSLLVAVFLLCAAVVIAQPGEQGFIMEGYPKAIHNRILAKEQFFAQRAAALNKGMLSPQQIFDISREWLPGQTYG